MQEPVDGIVGVVRFTIAQAQHGNEAMAMSVTFALCLFHASQSPFLRRRTPAQLQETHNAALARSPAQCSMSRQAGKQLAGDSGVTAFTVYTLSRSRVKPILPALVFKLSPWSRMLTDPLA